MLPGKLSKLAVAGGVTLALAVAFALPWMASGATQHNVVIQSFAFQPQEITVIQNDAITWTNRDPDSTTGGNGHTATANDGSWNTGPILQDHTSGPITFNTVGDFPYHCAVHPGMTGTVHVALPPGVTTTSTTRPPPTTTTRPPTTTTVRVTTTRPPTTTTEPPTTTTRRPPPPPREPRVVATLPPTTTTSSTTTTTERLDLSGGGELSNGDGDGDGGGGMGRFIVRLLLGLLLAVGGAAAASFVVTRLRGGGA